MNRLALLLVATLCMVPAANAQLYGCEPSMSFTPNLVTVNPTTGATTVVGPLGLALSELVATPTGGLLGSGAGGVSTLFSVNPVTGFATPVAPISMPGGLNGMEFDAVGTLYMTHIPSPAGPCTLGTVNTTTGAFSPIGPTGTLGPIGGLAFSPTSGLLLGVNSGGGVAGGGGPPTLYSISTTTGLATVVAPLAIPVPVSSLEYTSAGVLVAGGYDGILYAINETTGMTTPLGPHVTAVKLSGLADVSSGGAANCPGTGEDLITAYSLNLGPNITVGAGTDVLALSAGDLLQLTHSSPGGTFVGIGDVLVIGSTLPTGTAFPVVFPGLCINLPTAFGVVITVGGAPATLGPAGLTYAFIYSGASPGTSMMIQGVVTTGTAANTIFASTDGLELQL